MLTLLFFGKWKDPATDFRGGGLLALECLLYLTSSSHRNQVTEILTQKREYPFSAAGINIAHILMSDFLRAEQHGSFQQQIFFLFFFFSHIFACPDFDTISAADEKWNSVFMTFLCNANAEDGFFVAFCMMILLLDATWVHMNATFVFLLPPSSLFSSFPSFSCKSIGRGPSYHFGDFLFFCTVVLHGPFTNGWLSNRYMDFPAVMSRCLKQFTNVLKRRPMTTEQFVAWVEQEILMLQHQ